MSRWLRDLGRNLWSGALLDFGQSVSKLRFRIGIGPLLVLFALSAWLDLAVDTIRREPGSTFVLTGLVSEGFYGALLMLFAALLALIFRQPSLALALPVILLSGEWPLQLARMFSALALGGSFDWSGPALRADQLIFFWSLFWLWRSAAVSLDPKYPHFVLRSLAAAVLLSAPLWFASSLLPEIAWWEAPAKEPARDARFPSPASEAVLSAQQEIFDKAIDDLEDERRGVTDLYFVGFAPYAQEDVFRKDMDVARGLFDERFDTRGRSIVLINNPRTVLEAPLATVTNLRATLKEIGATIDRDDDVVMVYLESHGGRDHRLAVEFPPLELDQLTPQLLREALDDAGIKWRIVIVSACYSGGYVEPLKDEYTLILTASAADRTSFGCGTESNATYFADAMFQHALRFEDSFVKAFAQARERIAQREQEQKMTPPSDPQIFVGDEMATKLPKLEATLRAHRASGTI
ncbi:MAG: C13 family peptidase [Pseudomonadota bacterium]|nr:C13 family peptidase [Pseudomonadota bacterium]